MTRNIFLTLFGLSYICEQLLIKYTQHKLNVQEKVLCSIIKLSWTREIFDCGFNFMYVAKPKFTC